MSARTIDAIASALQLTTSERVHIQRLIRPGHGELREDVSPALRRMVASMTTHPMFVLDHAWDIVLGNDAALAVFLGGSHEEDDGDNNILISTFTFCSFRSLFDDWEMVARGLLEMFRLDFALYADDPRSQAVVERLHNESELFRTLWEQHRVSEFPKGLRLVHHPTAGELVLEPTIYTVVESPGLRILLFTPYEPETSKRIAQLVEDLRAATPATLAAAPAPLAATPAPLAATPAPLAATPAPLAAGEKLPAAT